jgi:hypothetical protein
MVMACPDHTVLVTLVGSGATVGGTLGGVVLGRYLERRGARTRVALQLRDREDGWLSLSMRNESPHPVWPGTAQLCQGRDSLYFSLDFPPGVNFLPAHYNLMEDGWRDGLRPQEPYDTALASEKIAQAGIDLARDVWAEVTLRGVHKTFRSAKHHR